MGRHTSDDRPRCWVYCLKLTRGLPGTWYKCCDGGLGAMLPQAQSFLTIVPGASVAYHRCRADEAPGSIMRDCLPRQHNDCCRPQSTQYTVESVRSPIRFGTSAGTAPNKQRTPQAIADDSLQAASLNRAERNKPLMHAPTNRIVQVLGS